MKRKFTLIEILGVTILISILAAIGIAAYSYAMESSKESATRAMIVRLGAAFDALQSEGMLPVTKVGNNTKFVMLVFNPDPGSVNGNDASDGLCFIDGTTTIVLGERKNTTANQKKQDITKAYKIFAKAFGTDSIERNLNSDNQIIDGWGNPIYVRYPGKFNRGGFDIISAGGDGLFSEDGNNEPVDDIKKYRDADNEWLCDDIVNF